MNSNGARLFQGLQSYMCLQAWYNAEWTKGYWYMYYRDVIGKDRTLVSSWHADLSGQNLPESASFR